MLTYCFDIDGTLCTQEAKDYSSASPYESRIHRVNELYLQGNEIKLFTARGSQSGVDWTEETRLQVQGWGLLHHEIIFGKPHADYYIDDKGVHSESFDWATRSK